jgi:hypothetical protein
MPIVWELQPPGTLRACQAWTGIDFTRKQELNFSVFIRVKTMNIVSGDHVLTQFHLVVFLSYVSFGHHNLLWEICSTELLIQLALFVLHSVKYRLGVQIPAGDNRFFS